MKRGLPYKGASKPMVCLQQNLRDTLITNEPFFMMSNKIELELILSHRLK